MTYGQSKTYFDKIESKDEVFNSWISDIYEDDKGFIWVSTQDGVLRYDGYEFKTLRNLPKQGNSISANWVTKTKQDQSGNFWFGTYGEGLNKLDLKANQIVRFNQQMHEGSIIAKIITDLDDNLWVLSEKGISYKSITENVFKKIHESSRWSHISVTKNGKVWIVHNDDLYLFNKSTKQTELVTKLYRNIDFIESINNNLFLVSKNQGLLFSKDSIKKVSQLPKHIKAWSNFKNEEAYFAIRNKVYKYSLEDHSYKETFSFNNIGSVESLFIDSKGQLWVGTDKGLFKENKLAAKFNHDEIPHHARRIEHKKQTLYLAGNDGLHILKNKTKKTLLPNKDLISIYIDDNNTIWTGDIQGNLFEIDSLFRIKKHIIPYKDVSGLPNLFSIVEDAKNRLWLGTWNGIYILNKNGNVLDQFKLTVDKVDINYRILQMMVDSKDRLWIAGPSNGLFKIDNFSNYNSSKKDDSIRNYQNSSNQKHTLNTNVIIDIHEDKKGTIWVGTDAGVNIYNEENDRFDFLSNNKSPFDEKIMSIEHDSDNRIWLGTITKGIFVYNQDNHSFTHYDKKDGLISNAFLFTSSSSSKEGTLYFGTDQGIQIADPNKLKEKLTIQQPIITDFSVNANEQKTINTLRLPYQKTIELKPPYRNFSISFSSLNFTNNAKVNYAFQLEGMNDQWQFTKTKLNTAYFTNINKGSYTFKVKAYDTTQGIDNGVESSIKIIVIPPWYQSSLAYAFYIALFIGLVFLIYYLQLQRKIAQFKIEQLKKEERSKLQKLIANFHYLGLTSVFSIDDLDTIKSNQSEIYGILSYFATSLFDKNKTEEVLKDITQNCISKLHLEDCVIYWLDQSKNILVQKAAHGYKSSEDQEPIIINPIDIPVGKGIVGSVAISGVPEIISDVSQDNRYIVDDIERKSELAVPIFLNGNVVGVIDSEHSQKNFFTKGHLEIFQLLAILLEKKLTQIADKKTLTITNDNIYFKELKQVMKKQKLYRNPTISLVSIAEELNISPGYLSKLINQITHGNFNDFINSFRVEEVKKKLKNPEFNNYSILSIGLESGFNSKSVFYTAFKKHTGFSPSEYKSNKL
ncbi:two-component regulator propeller domain-containing protein [Pseudotenacibaculum sp. MALMAid0570]|uniref:two-component regulator propeller domain-containing protein n=1 Tax=Pseudotenacibaculum sp. MALMAid0570 TaxID=3143938 RepID=UPI0032DFA2BA